MGDGTPGTSIEKWSPPNFGFEEQMPHLRRRSKGVVVQFVHQVRRDQNATHNLSVHIIASTTWSLVSCE